MARQGNFVTLPGGGVNWTKDISSSLADLSKSFRDQGDSRLERERLAAAEEENRRRFDLGISRDDARNALEDSRYTEEQKVAAQRYADDLKFRQAKEARDAQIAAQQQSEWARERAERAALRATDNLATSGALQTHKFTLDDYRPEMRDLLQGSLDRVTRTKQGLANILTAGGDYDTKNGTFNTVVKDYRTLLENSDLTPDAVNNRVADFERDVLALAHERTLGGLNAEDWQKRVSDLTSARFDPLTNNINKGIAEGKGMLRRNAVSSVLRTLPPEVRNNILATQADTMFGNRLNFSTEADLKASEQARVDKLNAAEKVIYDRNLDRLKMLKETGQGGKGGFSDADSIIKAYKTLNVEGPSVDKIGSWDMDTMKDGLNYLINEKKLDPSAVAAVFQGGVEEDWWGNSFPKQGSDAFAVLEQRAQALSSGGGTGRKGLSRTDVDKTNFGYKPVQARDVLRLQTDNFKIPGSNNYRLDVPSQYQSVITQAENAAKAAKTSANPSKNPDPAPEPPKPTKKDILGQVQTGNITVDDLLTPKTSAFVAKTLADDAANTSGRTATRSSVQAPKPKEVQMSKAMLDAVETINKADRLIRKWYPDGVVPEDARSLPRQALAERTAAVNRLKALEGRLQNLSK